MVVSLGAITTKPAALTRRHVAPLFGFGSPQTARPSPGYALPTSRRPSSTRGASFLVDRRDDVHHLLDFQVVSLR